MLNKKNLFYLKPGILNNFIVSIRIEKNRRNNETILLKILQ